MDRSLSNGSPAGSDRTYPDLRRAFRTRRPLLNPIVLLGAHSHEDDREIACHRRRLCHDRIG